VGKYVRDITRMLGCVCRRRRDW